MAAGLKTTGQSYYDAFASMEQQVGDIWKGMPAFGHLRKHSVTGIVITPACDLANRKVETITYLPIIPVRQYLVSRGFAAELVRIIKGQGQLAKIKDLEDWQMKGIDLPADTVMLRTLKEANALSGSGGAKEKDAAVRICAAVAVLRSIRGQGESADLRLVKTALGAKEYERCISDVVRNAYSPDIHFLPSDGRAGDLSVIGDHSVVLFRYPMAVPVDMLDAANDIGIVDWAGASSLLSVEFPIVAHAQSVRPVKVGALRSRFLPDLISRFAALHIRMGAPDFTRETVGDFVNEFGESK
jgi:hypothetical protein